MGCGELSKRRRRSRLWAYWLVVYLPLALGLNEVHLRTVDKPNYPRQLALHREILQARTGKPQNIRVLQPVVVQAMMDWIPYGTEQGRFLAGYAAIRILSLVVLFCLAERLFGAFGEPSTARLGVLLLAAMHPMTFLDYFYQPSSVFDLACFTLGMCLIASGPHWPLIPLVIVATANRNTSAFICLAYGLYHLDALWCGDSARRRRFVALGLALGATWAVEIALLEWRFPANTWLEQTWVGYGANLTDDKVWRYVTMMCAPLAAGVWLGWRGSPAALKRMAVWALLYLAVHLFMARAYELRYYLALYVGLGPFCVLAYERFDARAQQPPPAVARRTPPD